MINSEEGSASGKGRTVLPPLTDEERAAALAKSLELRRARAALKKGLKRGVITVPEVLAMNTEAAAGIRVTDLFESVPGVGKVKAGLFMERLRISPSRRLRGLGRRQRAELLREFQQ